MAQIASTAVGSVLVGLFLVALAGNAAMWIVMRLGWRSSIAAAREMSDHHAAMYRALAVSHGDLADAHERLNDRCDVVVAQLASANARLIGGKLLVERLLHDLERTPGRRMAEDSAVRAGFLRLLREALSEMEEPAATIAADARPAASPEQSDAASERGAADRAPAGAPDDAAHR